jgi:ribosomal protein S18 acetylase RimI-like enzyme
MTAIKLLLIILAYFFLLMAISDLTSRNNRDTTYFDGNRSSRWFLVAFGMIGSGISAVSLVSIPGYVGNNKLYLQTLFVPDTLRGKGFRNQLLEFGERPIYRTSPNVFICVSTFNTRALRLYETMGFNVVGVLKDFLKPGFDEWLLRKTIGHKLGYVTTR